MTAMINSQKILSSAQLPTLPTVAIELLELSRNPELEIAEVVTVIKHDPAISGRILKAANSTLFGFVSEIASVERAVPLIGTATVTSLALSFWLKDESANLGPVAEHYDSYWMQSIVQALAAQTICRELAGLPADELFFAGMMLDIGRLALLKTFPDEYCAALNTAWDETCELHETESKALGINHVEIGSEVMQHWSLPETLIECVRYHHSSLPVLLEVSNESSCGDQIKALAVASSIGDYFCSTNKARSLERLTALTEEFFELSESELERLLNEVRTRVTETGDLYSADTDQLADPSEIMAEAREQMAQLALQAQLNQRQAEQQINELEEKNNELQTQVLRDPLTNVYNRHLFDEVIRKELARGRRHDKPVGVIFVDIDDFKKVNDTYGHSCGDAVLKWAATTISGVLRDVDILARYGGDEFVILVNRPSTAGVKSIAGRIRAAIESDVFEFDGQKVAITMSVGASIEIPESGESDSGAGLIAAADEAMYKAKQNGRNQVVIAAVAADQME